MIIGLTGGIASGKTTVRKLFSDLGIETFSADQINNDLLKYNTIAFKKILAHFGNQILLDNNNPNNNQEINKSFLREKIFNSNKDRQWLEKLLHPLIQQEINKIKTSTKTRTKTSPYIILEIPLLIEKQLQLTVDRILVVDCNPHTQLDRAIKRDNQSSAATIKKIFKIQTSRENRLSYSNDLLNNNGSLDNLQLQVEELHKLYLRLTKS